MAFLGSSAGASGGPYRPPTWPGPPSSPPPNIPVAPPLTVGANVAVGEIVIINAIEGSTPTDSKGNVYQALTSSGQLLVYYAFVTAGKNLVSGVDTISVGSARGFRAYSTPGTDYHATYPIIGSITASGVVGPGNGNYTVRTGNVTIPPGDSAAFAVGAGLAVNVTREGSGNNGGSSFEGTIGFLASCASEDWIFIDYAPETGQFDEWFPREIYTYGGGSFIFDFLDMDASIQISFGWNDPTANWYLTNSIFRYVGSTYTPPLPGTATGSQLISRDRGTLGRLVQARVSVDNQLLVDIYNDDFPEIISNTSTIESSNVGSCSTRVLRGQYPKKTHKGLKRTNTDRWLLTYLHSDALKLRQSFTQGETWDVSTTIASGYQGFIEMLDMHPLRGLWVICLYDNTNTKWRITVGSLLDNGTWSFSTIRDLVTSSSNAAVLKIRPDGIWEFTHRTAAGSIVTLRCRNLQADGTGTWS